MTTLSLHCGSVGQPYPKVSRFVWPVFGRRAGQDGLPNGAAVLGGQIAIEDQIK